MKVLDFVFLRNNINPIRKKNYCNDLLFRQKFPEYWVNVVDSRVKA